MSTQPEVVLYVANRPDHTTYLTRDVRAGETIAYTHTTSEGSYVVEGAKVLRDLSKDTYLSAGRKTKGITVIEADRDTPDWLIVTVREEELAYVNNDEVKSYLRAKGHESAEEQRSIVSSIWESIPVSMKNKGMNPQILLAYTVKYFEIKEIDGLGRNYSREELESSLADFKKVEIIDVGDSSDRNKSSEDSDHKTYISTDIDSVDQ